MNKSDKWVRARLHVLHRDGKLATGRRMIDAIDGRSVYVPSYWLKA